MRVTKLFTFIIQFATVGLAAAFLILYFQSGKDTVMHDLKKPDGTEIVELIESTLLGGG